jgi:pescadillo
LTWDSALSDWKFKLGLKSNCGLGTPSSSKHFLGNFVHTKEIFAPIAPDGRPRLHRAMAKIKKRGTSGQARNYITRTQAVRKLQISLPDFRRLCIFKGIYPREPRNNKKASKSSTQATTFYYAKDIQYLLHEPLLAKFREQKALSKKVARSLGRNEVNDAVRLQKYGTPKITLDHIIRERYPTFVDAIRDLDDALSLLFLFANLPSTSTVPPKVIARCQRLCHEFEHYLITTNSLRKSFLSIKGIYYQATIQGQDVMWLVPYRFVQKTTQDVDYRIMGTFVDFYSTLLGFVNFRLYTSIGLVYPPKFNAERDEKGAELAAFTLEGRRVGASLGNGDNQKAIVNGYRQVANTAQVQKQLDQVANMEDPDWQQDQRNEVAQEDGNDAIDAFETTAPEGDTLAQPDVDGDQAASLFSDFTFYISREAPRHPIELLLRAFGCKRVGWDPVLGEGAFTNDETDSRITHQVVDRPSLPEATSAEGAEDRAQRDGSVSKSLRPGMRVPGRNYVQPQWIWDCINEGRLLRPDLYAPGATLPPHLSPWVKAAPGQYDPRATLAEQEPEGEARRALADGDEEMEEVEDESPGVEALEENIDEGGMQVAGTDDETRSEDDIDEDGFAGFDEEEVGAAGSEHDEEDERSQHQKELEAEVAGLPFSAGGKTDKVTNGKFDAEAKKRAAKKREEDEELGRQKMMMSRKKRKLFEKMQYSNSKRDAEAEKLRNKRRKLERPSS